MVIRININTVFCSVCKSMYETESAVITYKFTQKDNGKHIYGVTLWPATRQNLASGFPTKQDSNQSPQLQGLARKLKFRL